jgi:hypothetical protein
MKYESGAAFRRALEDRLRANSLRRGTPLVRLRKMVAFDRLLARLLQDQPGRWILKGGLALQLRLGERARTTKDIDVLLLDHELDIYTLLRRAGALNLGDWFSFEIGFAQSTLDDPGGKRFPIQALLDSRTFETFHIDVGIQDPVIESPDHLATRDLLLFAGIQPTIIPCYPLNQQIAEKLHAYTRIHASGESSRVKDFVDMLLIASLAEVDGEMLQQALEATFNRRNTHLLPERLPEPPHNWQIPFKKLANEVGVNYDTLDEAFVALRKFLEPALAGDPVGVWDNEEWHWR